MNISPITNYNAYSFCARHEIESEKINSSTKDRVIHTSNFFREPFTDKFVQQYVLDNFSNNKDVKVVSAGCSQGEEAYSYYVMLDSLKDKLTVSGFDLSEKIIEKAKKGIYSLKNKEQYLIETGSRMNLDNYERKCREKFRAHFEPADEALYRKPPYNYYPRSESSIYKLKEGEKGCEFRKGDVFDIDKMYEKNSVDVLLFRNTLYHLAGNGDNEHSINYNPNDNKKTINEIANKMGEVMKKGGLVVFGENEECQHVNVDYITDAMTKNGVKPVFLYDNPKEYMRIYDAYYNYSKPYSHVWRKV